MDLIPAEEGGDDYYLNGSYTKLKDAGASYGLVQGGSQEQQPTEPDETQPEEPEEREPDEEEEKPGTGKNAAERHEQRKAQRRGRQSQKRR